MGGYYRAFVFLLFGFVMVGCSAPRSAGHRDHTRNSSRAKTAPAKRKPDTAHHFPLPSRTPASEKRSEAVRYAKTLVGSGYRYGGTDKRGFDCSGFTSYVMRHIGMSIPRTSAQQASGGQQIHWKNAQSGDLVFFGRGGKIDHVGIVESNRGRQLYVIHSTTSAGVRVDEVLNHPYWSSRILGASTYFDRPAFRAESAGED